MKKWYTSKTVHFNLLMTAILIASATAEQFPVTAEFMLYIATVGNILLRVFFTDTKVEL